MPASNSKLVAPGSPEAHPSFESAMERLETIVEEMENSRLPLEELILCYEEGTKLIAVCSEKLTAAEQRIEIITRDAAGQRRNVETTAAGIAAEAAAAGVPAPPPQSSREVRAKPDAVGTVPGSPAASTSSAPSTNNPGRAPAKNRNEVSLF